MKPNSRQLNTQCTVAGTKHSQCTVAGTKHSQCTVAGTKHSPTKHRFHHVKTYLKTFFANKLNQQITGNFPTKHEEQLKSDELFSPCRLTAKLTVMNEMHSQFQNLMWKWTTGVTQMNGQYQNWMQKWTSAINEMNGQYQNWMQKWTKWHNCNEQSASKLDVEVDSCHK